jgi:hypothetical protein
VSIRGSWQGRLGDNEASLSLFCRHNRFTADCPICAKGTVLDARRKQTRRPATGKSDRASAETPTRAFSGPHVSVGPYADGEGSYEVRLERVPGGLRLAEWDGSGLRRRAPVLAAADLRDLVDGAAGVLDQRDAAGLAEAVRREPENADARGGEADPPAPRGVSRGRSGDFKEELRVEALSEERVRVARWMLRPGSGWELRDAPPMLPAARYAEAFADAARKGLLLAASDAGGAARL